MNYNKNLLQISNILILNQCYIKETGLVNGPLELALFFYNYAKYTNNDMFEKIADGCINLTYSAISDKTRKDFSNGLGGIGWTFRHLAQEGFVILNSSTLADVDMCFIKTTEKDYVKERENIIPLFSKGLYLSTMVCNEQYNKLVTWIDNNINILINELLPLCYYNSIIYFLKKSQRMNVESEKCKIIENKLYTDLPNQFQENKPTSQDLYVFEKFANNNICGKPDLTSYDVIRDVYMNWQTIVYYDLLQNLPPVNEIDVSSFLASVAEDLPTREITLGDIACLGINLMKNERNSLNI